MKINKVAICISGHLRGGHELCFPSLKKYLLDKYDCDIFISAFKEMGNVQFVHRTDHPIEEIDTIPLILDTYKPKRISTHTATSEWIDALKSQYGLASTRNTAKLYQIAAMHRNMYEVNQLRKMYQADTGTKYDVVIRMRFDTEFLSDIIEDSHYKSEIDLTFKLGYCGIYDQTFWGSPELMDAAMECYLYMPQFVSNDNCNQFENAENIFTTYLNARSIPFTVRNEIKVSVTKPHGRHVN